MGSAVRNPRLSFLQHSCVTVALSCWENYLKCEKISGLKSWKIQKRMRGRKKCGCWDSANQQIRDSVWKMMTWKGIKSWQKFSKSKDEPVQRTRKLFPRMTINCTVNWDSSGTTITDGKPINAFYGSFLIAAIYHMY